MFLMFVFSNPVLRENYIMFCIPYDFVRKVQSIRHTIQVQCLDLNNLFGQTEGLYKADYLHIYSLYVS